MGSKYLQTFGGQNHLKPISLDLTVSQEDETEWVMSELHFSGMRKELVEYIEVLSDRQYQEKFWVRQERTVDIQHDEFDYAIHFLFDDTDLARDPNSTVGFILKDASEVEVISGLILKIDDIFNKYGTGLTDEQYMATPEWVDVICAAKRALDLFVSQEK